MAEPHGYLTLFFLTGNAVPLKAQVACLSVEDGRSS